MSTQFDGDLHKFIRVGNKRVNADDEFKPNPGEVIVNIDMPHTLGNRHVRNSSLHTLQKIDAFKVDLLADFERHGPMWVECRRIATWLTEGRSIILMCWCKPAPCHGDVLLEEIIKLTETL